MTVNTEKISIQRLLQHEDAPYSLLLLADPSKEMIDSYLSDSEIYVALFHNRVIGVVVLYPLSPSAVEIKNIAVESNFQGKGIGKFLLQQAILIACQQGMKKILIGTANSSIGQLFLYQQQGFEIMEIRKNFFLTNYPNPIIENGIQAKHLIMLQLCL